MGFRVILSKELKRVFGDKKMIFSMFILPVLLIGGLFLLMFNLADKSEKNIDNHQTKAYIMGAPDDFIKLMLDKEDCYDIYVGYGDDFEMMKEHLITGEVDVIVEFPRDFEEVFLSDDKEVVQQIKTYYNPSEEHSAAGRERFVQGYLEEYRQLLLTKRFENVNYATIYTVDTDNPDMIVQDEKKATGKALGMIIPYFVTIMLFAGAMGLGVDSIAGEKERGTMANLLISPVKRSEIIMGKITGLGIVSLISAIVYVASMAGVMIYSAKQSDMGGQMQKLSLDFDVIQVIQLIIIILGITFLYVALIGMVSVMAKNMKEAQTFIMPLYIIVMVAGMTTMYTGSAASTVSYAIPLYNTSVVFKGIFSMEMTMTQFIIAAAVTYGTALLVVALMTKAIKSEKIMFNA